MTNILLIVQVVLMLLIVLFVLLQKSSSIGLGAYSGSNDSLFGAKGPMNFLAKGTLILGFLFVCNTLSLGYMYNQEFGSSVLDNSSITPTVPVGNTAPDNPLAPSAPAIPGLPQ